MAPRDPRARAEALRLLAAGYRPPTVAAALNRRQVPTATGRGQWWPATVRRMADPAGWRAHMAGYRARRR